MNFKFLLTLSVTLFSFTSFSSNETILLDFDQEDSISESECVYYALSPRAGAPFGTFIRYSCTDARVACSDYLSASRSRSDWSCESFRYWPSRSTCSYELRKNGQSVKKYTSQGFGRSNSSAQSNACRFAKDTCERIGGPNGFCRKL